MKTLLSAVIFISLLFSSSCKSDNPYTIPYVPVGFYVFPTLGDSELGVTGFKYFPYGYRGIIVYNNGLGSFLAYDRACPFDTQNTKAIVAVDPSGVVAVCPVCHSKFLLKDGYPFQGPAKSTLLQYQTSYNGGNSVYVSN